MTRCEICGSTHADDVYCEDLEDAVDLDEDVSEEPALIEGRIAALRQALESGDRRTGFRRGEGLRQLAELEARSRKPPDLYVLVSDNELSEVGA